GFLAIIPFRPPSPEPQYQGKPLNYWLGRGYTNVPVLWAGSYVEVGRPPPGVYRMQSRGPPVLGDFPTPLAGDLNPDQIEAVRAIGTNGIPTLLRMLRAADSALLPRLAALAQRQHLIKINFTPAANQNFWARQGFRMLGPTASNDVPALMKIYEQNISPSSRLDVLDSLGWIGPAASNAVPMLVRALSDTNSLGLAAKRWRFPGYATNAPFRITALWALEEIH